MTDNDPKELVWLPKKLADKVKALENSDNFVEEYIQESKRELRSSMEEMDDDIIIYKSAMIKAREQFRLAKDEMLSTNYAIWEKFEKDSKQISSLAGKAKDELLPLKTELLDITKLIAGININKIDRLFEVIQKVSTIMDGEHSQIAKFLMSNFQKIEN